MDHHCFYRQEQNNYLHASRSVIEKFLPQPCPYITFQHCPDFEVELNRSLLNESNALDALQGYSRYPGSCVLRVLLPPPRTVHLDKYGKEDPSNPESAIPFSQPLFNRIVEHVGFHKGFFSHHRHSKVARLESGLNITSFYIETGSHRNHYCKVFVSFDARNFTTTAMLHNLLAQESDYIDKRLTDPALRSLTIHPLLIPVLLMELLSNEALGEARRIFSESIGLQHKGDLHTNDRFKHLVMQNLDIGQAAEQALGTEQRIVVLVEKIGFATKMSKKVISWFDDLEIIGAAEDQKLRFETAGSIIKDRIEFLADALDLQMTRMARARSVSQVNRTGLESRNATIGNKFNARISEQSRDIARESKRDSSAMKAIAVLTMFFLPGTFVAAFFAMPLFDWEAKGSSPAVNSKFWIYWAVAIPSTICVLMVWRVWYKFQEWVDSTEGRGKNSTVDFWAWLRSGSPRGNEEGAGSKATSFVV